MKQKSVCYIIAGPNGVGKTTFAREFLPHYVKCLEFVNPDLIAQGLSPFDPSRSAMDAGRVVLERFRDLIFRKADFAMETTLSGRSFLKLFHEMKRQGYELHLFYLWVSSPELALMRIADRVRHGGHDVPEREVRRRFSPSLKNLFQLYAPILDSWRIYDNSGLEPNLVMKEEEGLRQILLPETASLILKERSQ
jgi:predicted ABC-type ATPase